MERIDNPGPVNPDQGIVLDDRSDPTHPLVRGRTRAEDPGIVQAEFRLPTAEQIAAVERDLAERLTTIRSVTSMSSRE